MLDQNGFDLWSPEYDASVRDSDEDATYPFAGYRTVLHEIFHRVVVASAQTVLDIGFGTGTLTAQLYAHGCEVFGQDFSEKMIETAQKKMPNAKLLQGDFTNGLAEPLTRQKYDAIIATYSLHHLTDTHKVRFLRELLPLLNDGGCVYIGDVAFENRAALEKCRADAGDEWDDDEIYFVCDELKHDLPTLEFEPMSPCAGLITLRNPNR